MSYTEETIDSVGSFVDFIDKKKVEEQKTNSEVDFLFRGQPRDLSLLPKLARLSLRGDIINIEKLIVEEFRRTSHPLAEFQPQDDWDLLALAQHHGLPTRLLDWTYSGLVALWFAVKEAPHKNGQEYEDGVVWILIPDLEDYRGQGEVTSPLSNKITRIFRPKVISRRISSQSGAFTVHKINNGGKVVPFEKHSKFSDKLVKVNIPHGSFSKIRKSLHMLGVNHAMVFPDIDGLCRHLEWRFSKLDDEKTSRRTIFPPYLIVKKNRKP
jgi:FRG domain